MYNSNHKKCIKHYKLFLSWHSWPSTKQKLSLRRFEQRQRCCLVVTRLLNIQSQADQKHEQRLYSIACPKDNVDHTISHMSQQIEELCEHLWPRTATRSCGGSVAPRCFAAELGCFWISNNQNKGVHRPKYSESQTAVCASQPQVFKMLFHHDTLSIFELESTKDLLHCLLDLFDLQHLWKKMLEFQQDLNCAPMITSAVKH